MNLTNNGNDGGNELPEDTEGANESLISVEDLLKESEKSETTDSSIDEDRQEISDKEFKRFKENTEERFSDIETLTKAILYVGIISLVGVIVAVIAILVQQMQFNNSTYEQRKTDSQKQIELLREEVQSLRIKSNHN